MKEEASAVLMEENPCGVGRKRRRIRRIFGAIDDGKRKDVTHILQ